MFFDAFLKRMLLKAILSYNCSTPAGRIRVKIILNRKAICWRPKTTPKTGFRQGRTID